MPAKVCAHGRVEVLGNHTDYNKGLALAMGVEYATTVKGSRRTDDRIILRARDLKKIWEGSIQAIQPSETESWANYILGVLQGLKECGIPLGGVELEIHSNLPMGAGLSSSAALAIAALRCLKKIFRFTLPPLEMAKLAQQAEHRFAGVKCGLLDPMTILHAKKDHLLLLDFSSMQVKAIPFPQDAVFLIANSGEKHALVTGEYNERRESCEEAARLLGIASLRKIAPLEFVERKEELPERVFRRAAHVVFEIARVSLAVLALGRENLIELGRLMDESHVSSKFNFENSTPSLDHLCEVSQKCPGHLGARLSGGGFGGSTLHLIESNKQEEFVSTFQKKAHTRLGHPIDLFVTSPSGI